MAKPPKLPELKAWDRPPWPKKGDSEIDATYLAVGKALSSWETFELQLSVLFTMLVGNPKSRAAQRAYVAVRTFEGRAEMLKAASEAHFNELPDKATQDVFKEMFARAKKFSERRNDIAHGVVSFFVIFPTGRQPGIAWKKNYQWAQYPSYANFKERDLTNVPSYCMSSIELNHFSEHFLKLADDTSKIVEHFLIQMNKRASKEKLPERDSE